ncbi:hypothetical protein [Solilutibacter pythonis]|uniref:hypothetical protein n=1 Tax=Solilutibacter pythonis TaxID=2483112 RepID=UPI0011C41AAC|nr:hypothetical protein [Lysobacter pythonis]
MKFLKARNFAPLAAITAFLPALSLTAYQLEWVDRGSLEAMVRLVAVVIPLDQMVSSSNIRRQSAVYYAFAFPQIPVFMVYVIGEIKNSNWFRTPYTKKQKFWAPIVACLAFAFAVLGLVSFEGRSTRYFAIGDKWGVLACFG